MHLFPFDCFFDFEREFVGKQNMRMDEAYSLSWVEVAHKMYGREWREEVIYDAAREIRQTIMLWSMADAKDKQKVKDVRKVKACPAIDAFREDVTLWHREKQKKQDQENIRKAWHR